jgi:hypothetical protein
VAVGAVVSSACATDVSETSETSEASEARTAGFIMRGGSAANGPDLKIRSTVEDPS